MKSLFVPAALVSISFLGVSAADAQNPACFTLASLQGSWAVVVNYGDNVAMSVAERVVDADGSWTSTYVLNEPVVGDPNGARALLTGAQKGTYNLNCDGTGTINRVSTSAAGVVTNQVDNFVITGSIVKNGEFIATSITDASQNPNALAPGGVFVTRVHSRLPDRPGPTQP
jgi:hypothetical protein